MTQYISDHYNFTSPKLPNSQTMMQSLHAMKYQSNCKICHVINKIEMRYGINGVKLKQC